MKHGKNRDGCPDAIGFKLGEECGMENGTNGNCCGQAMESGLER